MYIEFEKGREPWLFESLERLQARGFD